MVDTKWVMNLALMEMVLGGSFETKKYLGGPLSCESLVRAPVIMERIILYAGINCYCVA